MVGWRLIDGQWRQGYHGTVSPREEMAIAPPRLCVTAREQNAAHTIADY